MEKEDKLLEEMEQLKRKYVKLRLAYSKSRGMIREVLRAELDRVVKRAREIRKHIGKEV